MPRGESFERVGGATSGALKRVDSHVLQVYTNGHLSQQNSDQGVFASARLALQMYKELDALGFDGWIVPAAGQLATDPERNEPIAFHAEVLLWNSFRDGKLVGPGGQTLSRFPR